MNEISHMGDIRPKTKEMPFTPLQIKELADLIPKPENHFHYVVSGEWQPNREVYRVNEGNKVISDYSFPEKSDMSKVQFATRKTYTKELNMWGKLQDYPVSFDRKAGVWKKLNIFERVKQVFSKETHIPAQVIDEKTLHTLEQKRPVGEHVKEAKLDTVQDAQVELALKYKHVDHSVMVLKQEKKDLEKVAAASGAANVALERQLAHARMEIRRLQVQAVQREQAAAQAVREAQPHYEGPIYTKPNSKDVVDAVVTEAR